MKTINLFNKELKFENAELLKVAELATNAGYSVHTFNPSGFVISQVFIDNGRTFGAVQSYFSGVTYFTCHKSEYGSGNGSGFGMSGRDVESASIEGINKCFVFAPNWATNTHRIKKQTWKEYIGGERILEYAEIKLN